MSANNFLHVSNWVRHLEFQPVQTSIKNASVIQKTAVQMFGDACRVQRILSHTIFAIHRMCQQLKLSAEYAISWKCPQNVPGVAKRIVNKSLEAQRYENGITIYLRMELFIRDMPIFKLAGMNFAC